MCPFYSANFPDSLAFAEEGELIIGTIDYPKLLIHSIPLHEQALNICCQDYSQSFALGCEKHIKPSRECIGSIQLFNDHTFGFKSIYPLDRDEFSISIISCSFAGDNNVYYCVGTAFMVEHGDVIDKGRILILLAQDEQLKLVAEEVTNFWLTSPNAFQGKLLALINDQIKLYTWLLHEDGTHELKFECESGRLSPCCFVETRENVIVVGGIEKKLSLLTYKHEKGVFEELDCLCVNQSTAVKILDDDMYLGSDSEFNIFTICKNSEGAGEKEQGYLEVVGHYHLGDGVRRFQHGSLLIGMPDSAVGQIPTCIFGTMRGCIGIVASIPEDQYHFLDNLQSVLRKVIKSVGELSHHQWRSCTFEVEEGVKVEFAKNFLDGDLIESFLDLTPTQMEVVSKAMTEPVDVLRKKVNDLRKLR